MREVPTTRPDPYGWNVSGHSGSVTVRYKVYGDRVDGTYLGIDQTHAHINMKYSTLTVLCSGPPCVITYGSAKSWK